MNTTAGSPAAPAGSFPQLPGSSSTAALSYIFDIPPDQLTAPSPAHNNKAQPQQPSPYQQQQHAGSTPASSTGQPPPAPAPAPPDASTPHSPTAPPTGHPSIHAAPADAFSQQLRRVASILEGRHASALTEAARVGTGRLGPAHVAMDASSGTRGMRVAEKGLLVRASLACLPSAHPGLTAPIYRACCRVPAQRQRQLAACTNLHLPHISTPGRHMLTCHTPPARATHYVRRSMCGPLAAGDATHCRFPATQVESVEGFSSCRATTCFYAGEPGRLAAWLLPCCSAARTQLGALTLAFACSASVAKRRLSPCTVHPSIVQSLRLCNSMKHACASTCSGSPAHQQQQQQQLTSSALLPYQFPQAAGSTRLCCRQGGCSSWAGPPSTPRSLTLTV